MNQKIKECLSVIEGLRRLGIELNCFGFIALSESIVKSYSYDLMVKDLPTKSLFAEKPSAKNLCTLALAIHQEITNDYIDQSQIDFVNQWLDLGITYNDVQEYSSKYI